MRSLAWLSVVAFATGCASSTPEPIAPSPPIDDATTHAASLTGGVGNEVVASFDQIRAAVCGPCNLRSIAAT